MTAGKIKRKISHAFVRLKVRLNEKTYGSGGHRLKYYYKKDRPCGRLIVIFSAFPGKGAKAGYNMISILGKKIPGSKLFLLDDTGYLGRGSYYLGENGDYFVPKLVSDVIRRYAAGCSETVFLGSSKGGWSALYYGLKEGASVIIAGAPQYYLGKYLLSKPEHLPILDSVIGEGRDEKKIHQLDTMLKDEIISEKGKTDPEIIIHYSPNEPTYPEHISDMLSDLKENGYRVREDVENYENHMDVAGFFPALVTDILSRKTLNEE